VPYPFDSQWGRLLPVRIKQVDKTLFRIIALAPWSLMG
jgi:hypothetical protein